MKAFAPFRPWPATIVLALVMAGLLPGCATPKIDWAGRVGNYTYDQAVMDFGPPDKQAMLQDGTLVAEWLTRRGYVHNHVSGGYGYGYSGYYSPFFPSYIDTYQTPDYFLRLIFAPDRKLRDWKTFLR